MLDRHEQAGTYDDPEYEQAMQVYMDRHFYRGPQPRAELEAMGKGQRSRRLPGDAGAERMDDHRRAQGLELARAAARDRRPTLVVRGRHDMCTDPIAAELVNGIRGAREVVLEQSSHTPVLEETDHYLEVVGDFLTEAERAQLS